MSFDPPYCNHHLRFYYFLKSQEITEIITKPSQNVYEMCKLVNSVSLVKKTEKIQNYVKNVDFWLREICGVHGNVKYDGHTPSAIYSEIHNAGNVKSVFVIRAAL